MKAFLTLIFISVHLFAPCQNTVFEADTLSKMVKKPIRRADMQFEGQNFKDALKFYEQAYKYIPDNDNLNLQIGMCHYYLNTDSAGLNYYKKAARNSKNFDPSLQFYLAASLQLNQKYSEALDVLLKLKSQIPNENIGIPAAQINKSIQECKAGQALLETESKKIRVNKLSNAVNSNFYDYGAYLSSDDKSMYFTSSRNKLSDEAKDDDIYISQKTDTIWSKAKPIGKPVNTVFNEAVTGIHWNDKSLFVYSNSNNGDIYISKKDDSWSEPILFAPELTSAQLESSIFFSKDGKTVFFVSNRNGTLGGKDIFVSKLQNDNTWTEPNNIGSEINTLYDEESPFLSGDTLYFASKGHNTVGGYDIFKAHRTSDSNWSKPVNLGFPTNSSYDDFFYFQTQYNTYLSSDRKSGYGGCDIYMLKTIPQLKKEVIAAAENTDSVAEKDPQILNLTNFIFEMNSYENEAIYQDLNYLTEFLKTEPNARISLIGYTDTEGGRNYNLKLSKKRAAFIKQYLISQGVNEKSITAEGKGEANQISVNRDERGNFIRNSLKYNRRVEISVLKQGEKIHLIIEQIQVPDKYKLQK